MAINNYFTLADLKAYMPKDSVGTSTVWDDFVTTLCTNLSRAFDVLTWREPGAYAVSDITTRTYDGIPVTAQDFVADLDIGELADVPTSVTISGVAVPSSDYWSKPYNAAALHIPYTSLYLDPEGSTKSWGSKLHSIIVSGKFGYSISLPPAAFEAVLLYGVKFLRKAQQNYLETGTILDTGQVMVAMKVDEDLAQLIQVYRRSRTTGER